MCFTNSSRAKLGQSSQKRSRKRKANKNQCKNKLGTDNEKFIKKMSNKDVSERETALLAKGVLYANSSTDFT